jgi:hypothetical protein
MRTRILEPINFSQEREQCRPDKGEYVWVSAGIGCDGVQRRDEDTSYEADKKSQRPEQRVFHEAEYSDPHA